MKEFYFTTFLTENEHDYVGYIIEEFCKENNIKFNYYRKFKKGHQPGYRECKVAGDINKFKKFLQNEQIITGNANKKEYYKGRKIEKFLADTLKKF